MHRSKSECSEWLQQTTKGKKFKVLKTQLKWHDREEHITRFLTVQTTRQTKL
jgi:hypothetical protein